MVCLSLLCGLSSVFNLQAAGFELDGRIEPPASLSISLTGTSAPFQSATASDPAGRFRIRNLPAGTYVVSALDPVRGELRETVEVGPGTADSKGRVNFELKLARDRFEMERAQAAGAVVSAKTLEVPVKARREYEEAQHSLERREIDKAVAHLTRAVELFPRFTAAWNEQGTIAYQQGNYTHAEECFRKGLDADPDAFEPLVNLGGVLLNLNKSAEALEYNQRAVERRPNDALANSQLGLSYFALGNLDSAEKYLTVARKIDPAHFSNPELVLAQIHMRRNETAQAIADWEDFLHHHPDAPQAARIREILKQLRSAPR